MRALFLGGPQHSVMLNLPKLVPYWDFAVKPEATISVLSNQLPDELLKLDRVRYKLAMFSLNREEAIYTECGDDVLDALTRIRDYSIEVHPRVSLRRKPEPVSFTVRSEDR